VLGVISLAAWKFGNLTDLGAQVTIELPQVVNDIADTLVEIDSGRACFKAFRPGVGPYGEPQLLRLVAERLDLKDPYRGLVATKRCPDLLIKGHWALEQARKALRRQR
jgi:hypothetical protein